MVELAKVAMDSPPVIFLLLLSLLSVALGIANDFPNKFFQTVLTNPTNTNTGNIIVSPSALREALAQLYLGAEGKAAAEIKDVIHLTGPTKNKALEEFRHFYTHPAITGGGILEAENWLYVANDLSILPQYESISAETFATIAVREYKEYDKWIKSEYESESRHVTQFLFRYLDNRIATQLGHVVSFQGNWLHRFNKFETIQMPFYTHSEDGDRITEYVDSMTVENDFAIEYNRILNADILSLPYKNSNVSMLIILPKLMKELPFVESHLHLVDLRTLLKNTPEQFTKVILPKFQVGAPIYLNYVLQNMGIYEIFNNPDLSSLTNFKESIYVNAFQDALIKVHEEGSETDAVRNYSMEMEESNDHQKNVNENTGRVPQQIFHVYSPFIFAIRDEQQVYFIGRIQNLPKEYTESTEI